MEQAKAHFGTIDIVVPNAGYEGKAHPVQVEVDGEWNGLSRVVQGLSAGDRIVSLGAFKLKDGDAVRTVAP